MTKNVLIVDDSKFMRTIIRTILVRNGFNIIGEADNGANAIAKYKQLKPDIVTMDITMPEMNGIDTVKLIKQMNPEAKVIMISAMGQESLVKDAILAGADDFVVKPFREETIIMALNKV